MATTRTVFIDTALSGYASLATQYDANIFNIVLLNGASPGSQQIQNWLTSNNVSSADINVVSPSHSLNGLFTPRLVFIDPGVANFQTVIAGMPANATVVVLDASRDGVQQIHDYLATNTGLVAAIDIITDIASLDVISHGAPGEVMLGSTVLSAANLANYSSQLADIGSHLTAGADILLYGCDVAAGTTGQQFIAALAAATGADVAASTDLTGSAAAGGNWVLEANTGTIETTALSVASYDGVLDTASAISSFTISADTGSSSSDLITKVAAQTISGSFSASTANSQAPTVYVSTDGSGATRTAATITYTDNSGSGTFTVSVNLVAGAGKSIQFWTGANGNNQINSSQTQAYTLDTTAPTTSVSTVALSNDTGSSSTDFITKSAAQTISGTLSANTLSGEVVKISLDNGLTWLTASNTVGSNTYSLSGATLVGSNTLKVQVEDVAGNAGTTLSRAYVLDTVAPSAGTLAFSNQSDTGISGDGITSDNTFDLSLTGNEAGSTALYQVSTNGGASWATTNAAQSSLVDGSYQFRAQVTDAAGNSATTSAISVVVDATAPSAPAITGFANNSGSTLDTVTNDNTPTLTITAEADATVNVFKAGLSIGTATQTAPHSGIYTYTAAALADGSYNFTAKATDAAGNVSAASSVQNVVVDTTLTAPTVALVTDSGQPGDGLTNKANLSFNSADGDATRVIKVDGNVVGSYDPSTLTDGSHTVSVTDTDAAANSKTASLTFTLDTTLTAPTVALVTDSGLSGDGLTNKANLSFNTADSDAVRVIKVDGNVVGSYDPSTLADGSHTVSVTDTDAAANSKTASLTFKLDTTADAGNDLTVHVADNLVNNAEKTAVAYTVTGLDADASATATFSDGAHSVSSSTGSVDLSSLSDGPITVTIAATDNAGNHAAGAGAATVLDTTADAGGNLAVHVADSLVNNAEKTAVAYTVTGLDTDASATATFTDGAAHSVSSSTGSVDLSSLSDGPITVTIAATDNAGNHAAGAGAATVLDTSADAGGDLAVHVADSLVGDAEKSSVAYTVTGLDADASATATFTDSAAHSVSSNTGSVDLSSLSDGPITVTIAATDNAGNHAAGAGTSTVLDTTADAGNNLAVHVADGLVNNAEKTAVVYTVTGLDADASATATFSDGAHSVSSSTGSVDLSNLSDGPITVTIAATDNAGNHATGAGAATVLDTTLTAPTLTLVMDSGQAGDGLTNQANLSFNTADSDATRVIKVDGNVVGSYDASALADGSHTVSATDTDVAGNTKTASLTFKFDTTLTAPTVALHSDTTDGGVGHGTDTVTSSAVLDFNGKDGDAVRVIKVDGNVVGSYDASTLTDGSHTVSVTDTDGAANSKTASLTFKLDTTADAGNDLAVHVSDSLVGDAEKSSVAYTVTGLDADASATATFSDGAHSVSSSNGSVDLSSLTDGPITVTIAATDNAGNHATGAGTTTVLDTTADTGGDLAVHVADGLVNNAEKTAVAYTVTGLDADASATATFTDGAAHSVSSSTGSVDLSSLGDGPITVTIAATDNAGNHATGAGAATVLDTTLTAPTLALVADSGQADDGLTNQANLSFNTADNDATRVIKVDGNVVGSYDPSTLTDGSHTVSATDTDVAGNTKTASLTFKLDTTLTAPTVALVTDSGQPGDGLTNQANLSFNSADSDAVRVIKVDGNVVGSYDPSALTDGSHTVSVTDTDGAANSKTALLTFKLDTTLTAPTVALVTDSGLSGDGLTNQANLSFNTADSDATRVIKVDGNVVGSYDAGTLADGSHTVSATDTDVAGNSKIASLTFTLDTTLTAPTVALVTDSGQPGDGLTNQANLSFNTADSDAVRVIKVDGNVVGSYDPSTLADGSHTVSATDTDGAANSKTASLTFKLDTTADAGGDLAVHVSDSLVGDAEKSSVAYTVTGLDADAVATATFSDGAAHSVSSNTGSVDLSSLTDGPITVTIAATDNAGNHATGAGAATVLDTTADAGNDLAVHVSDSLVNNAEKTAVAYTVTGLDADASATATFTDGAAHSVSSSTGSVDLSSLTDGPITVTIAATDNAGNHATGAGAATVLDTTLTAPTVALVTDSGQPGDGLTNQANLSFNSVDSDAVRVIKVDGNVVDSYDASTLADGSHTVSATDTDVAGNTKTASLTFKLDTTLTAPTVALVTDSGLSGDGLTNQANLSFNSADSDAVRVIKVDGNVVGSYDPSTLTDGSHTVSATDTDAAANSKTASLTFKLDTTADAGGDLAVHVADGLVNNAEKNVVTYTVTGLDADASAAVTFTDGAAHSVSSNTGSVDLSSLSDGPITVTIGATDSAGNHAAGAGAATVLDTTADAGGDLAVHVSDGLVGDAEKSTVAYTVTGLDADAAATATFSDGAHSVSSSTGSVDLSSLTDGSITVTIGATDSAGNHAAGAGTTTVLDTTLTAPSLALSHDTTDGVFGHDSDHLTSNAALNFNTKDSDAVRVIKIDGNVVGSYDASALADGSHTVSATDTDGAGNSKTASLTFKLDTTLTAPTVVLVTDSGQAGDGLTNQANLSFNTADSDATRVIKVDGNVVGSYDPSTLTDGSHTVSATDTDAAGNSKTASLTFKLDTTLTAPTVALVTDSGLSGDGLTNKANLSFNTADSDATRVIKVDGNVVGSYDPSALADGSHTVSVTDTDGAANSKTASLTFKLDTTLTAPIVALVTDSGQAGDGLTNKANLSFNTADSDATRVIKVDGNVVGSYDPSTLADGSHTVSVTDTDAAANTKTASLTFKLDTTLTAPTVTLHSDTTDGGVGHGTDTVTSSALLDFNGKDGDAVRIIKVDGNVVGSYDAGTLADGSHTVSVTDTDVAGNSKTAASTFTLDSKGPGFTSGATASVAENIGANQVVYAAHASDEHSVVYSLKADNGDDAGRFDISTAGVVTLKDNPNFESINAYHFTVVATDVAGNHTDQAVNLAITNVNEAPVASPDSVSTIENAPISSLISDFTFDQDAGDKLLLSFNSNSVSLTWANGDPNAPTTLVNPVTHATVDLSSLHTQASISADGASITLAPPAELDWLVTGQAVKAVFNYTVTDLGGLASSDSVTLFMAGSTGDKGLNLSGGNGNDILSGNATNNAEDVLQGGNGNDTISGYGGTDALYGGNGDDKLYGGAGIDYLYGDSGNDTLDGGTEGDFLFGGKGNDILTGGAGADKFVFEPQYGNDRILDFNIAEGDKLYFADFFSTPMTADAFVAKYVTDTGNDLLISLPGGSIVLVGVPSISGLAGAIAFGMPS